MIKTKNVCILPVETRALFEIMEKVLYEIFDPYKRSFNRIAGPIDLTFNLHESPIDPSLKAIFSRRKFFPRIFKRITPVVTIEADNMGIMSVTSLPRQENKLIEEEQRLWLENIKIPNCLNDKNGKELRLAIKSHGAAMKKAVFEGLVIHGVITDKHLARCGVESLHL